MFLFSLQNDPYKKNPNFAFFLFITTIRKKYAFYAYVNAKCINVPCRNVL